MTCTWEPDPACLGDKWDALDEAVKERSLMLATSTLQALTNNRVGTCPITIRPCPETKPCGCWGDPYGVTDRMPWAPVLWDGQWFNCVQCGSRCKAVSEVDLPGPVGYIDSIRVDGEEIDLADFDLDNGHILVWRGQGPSPIPNTQNLDLRDTEPGTWSITYSQSYPVTEDARLAVTMLAMEYAEACMPKGKCSLPRGVTNVVRNGVTFTVDAGLFINGLTGIEVVDAFIIRWAPAGSPTSNATVFDPRKAPLRRTNSLPRRVKPTPPGTTETYALTLEPDDTAEGWGIAGAGFTYEVVNGRLLVTFGDEGGAINFTHGFTATQNVKASASLDLWGDPALPPVFVGVAAGGTSLDLRSVAPLGQTTGLGVERGPIFVTAGPLSARVVCEGPGTVMLDNITLTVSGD